MLFTTKRVSLDLDRYVTDDDLPAADDVKIENLNQLVMATARFNDIESFIKYTETFRDESVSDNKEGVRLMTIHKSKGLEYPVIFLIGMVENILPSKREIWKKSAVSVLWQSAGPCTCCSCPIHSIIWGNLPRNPFSLMKSSANANLLPTNPPLKPSHRFHSNRLVLHLYPDISKIHFNF